MSKVDAGFFPQKGIYRRLSKTIREDHYLIKHFGTPIDDDLYLVNDGELVQGCCTIKFSKFSNHNQTLPTVQWLTYPELLTELTKISHRLTSTITDCSKQRDDEALQKCIDFAEVVTLYAVILQKFPAEGYVYISYQ